MCIDQDQEKDKEADVVGGRGEVYRRGEVSSGERKCQGLTKVSSDSVRDSYHLRR